MSTHRKLRNWVDTFVLPKQQERDMRVGTWSVSSLYRSGSLTALRRGLARYKLDLVDVQEFRWGKGGTLSAGAYMFVMGKETKIINCENDFWYTTD
jgi:hypothetical protein